MPPGPVLGCEEGDLGWHGCVCVRAPTDPRLV